MRNFKNACAKSVLLTTCLLMSATTLAQRHSGFDFDFDDSRRDRRVHRDNDRQNRGPRVSAEHVFVGQTMFPGDRLFLGRELGLRNFQGQEIEAVELQIEGMRRGGQARLTINQNPVSRVQDFRGRRVGDQTLVFPLKRSFIIGQNVQKLQVQFDGTAYVRSAVVILKKKPSRGNNVIEQQIGRDVFGMQNIPLTELIHVRPRMANRPVKKVVITLRNKDRVAQLRLCEDQFGGGFRGRSRGANCQNTQLAQGQGRREITLRAQGLSLNELSLLIRGDIKIRKMKVHFRK